MELYTLDGTFLRDTVVDEYESLIWTERYSKNGDFQLVLPSTPQRAIDLAEGQFVGLRGSDEVIQIQTQSIENGLMTVNGITVETFFNERWILTSIDPAVHEWKLRDHPGKILGKIVEETVIAGGDYLTPTYKIGGILNEMPYLVLGPTTAAGDIVNVTVPFGPMYDALASIAETYKIGMKLYLSRADPFGYEFSFTTWVGEDRTSAQLVNDLVRFSAGQDSLANGKELHSISGYKTVAYVFPPSWSPTTAVQVVYAPGVDPTSVGFDRRVLVLEASDISSDEVTGTVTLISLMQQKGKDALANNNFIKVFDGEVIPQPNFVYGTDYYLGDIVELVDQSGIPQRAMITEYIRSKDATGESGYPTVSVVP